MPTFATLVGFEADFRAFKDTETLSTLDALLQSGQDGDATLAWFTDDFATFIAAESPSVTLVAAVEDNLGVQELIEVADGKFTTTAVESRGDSRERFNALVGVETLLTRKPALADLTEGSSDETLRALDKAKWTSAQLIDALDAASNQDTKLRTRLFQVLTMKTSAQIFERVLRGLQEEHASVAEQLEALIWRQGQQVTQVLDTLESEWRKPDSDAAYVERLVAISAELPDVATWLRGVDPKLAAAVSKARSPSDNVRLPSALCELPEVDSAALEKALDVSCSRPRSH